MGQALVAAAKSVSEDVHVHSLHCYFVRAGKPPPPCPQPTPGGPAGTSSWCWGPALGEGGGPGGRGEAVREGERELVDHQ